MGFLSQLRDIGIGSRGPYGRQVSGAQRLSYTLDEWAGEKQQTGINKALINASSEGKAAPDEIIDISDRWDVPLNTVRQLAEPINAQWDDTWRKQAGKKFYLLVDGWMDKHPGDKEGLEKFMPEAIRESIKGTDITQEEFVGPAGMIMQKMVFARGQKKEVANFQLGSRVVDRGPGGLTSIDNRPIVTPPTTPPKDTRTPSIKEYEYGLKHPKFAQQQGKEEETRTGDQKERAEFIKENPEYKDLSMLEWKKQVKQSETDPLTAATRLAQSNLSVQVNPDKLGEVTNSILKIWAKRRPELQKLVIDDTGIDPDLIDRYMKKYPKRSRQEIIKAIKKRGQ